MVATHRLKVRAPKREPDPDEEAALDCAVAAYSNLRGKSPRDACAVIICEWIMERSRRAVEARLPYALAFDLHDAEMRGAIRAALPRIGEAIGHLPTDTPLFELTREQIVDVFMAGLTWIGQAEVAVGEASGQLTREREIVRQEDWVRF